jgi:hypothetical protein
MHSTIQNALSHSFTFCIWASSIFWWILDAIVDSIGCNSTLDAFKVGWVWEILRTSCLPSCKNNPDNIILSILEFIAGTSKLQCDVQFNQKNVHCVIILMIISSKMWAAAWILKACHQGYCKLGKNCPWIICSGIWQYYTLNFFLCTDEGSSQSHRKGMFAGLPKI